MIDKVLGCIEKKLDEFIRNKNPSDTMKRVISSSAILQNGEVNPDCKDKVVMQLTNVQASTMP